MQPNREIGSRLPLPRSGLWSAMIDPRRTGSSTSIYADSGLKSTTNTRMSTNCVKPMARIQTETSTAVQMAVRLGPHPYLSATVRPTLKKGADPPVVNKQMDEYKEHIIELEEELRRYKELNSELTAKLESTESAAIVETIDKRPESDGFRVIHLKHNPVSIEFEDQRLEFKKVCEENQRLSAKLELLENGCDADVTRQLDEGIKSRQQLEKLQQKLESSEKRQQRIIEAFKRTSKEFREVCWRLLGYRIDMMQNNTYRLSNVYSDSPEDYLMFQLESDQIKLLESQYSRRLSDCVNTYLTDHDSYPAFLASLTLDLFRKQTII